MTSTSTVGLPRLSRISRPWMWTMSVMANPLVSACPAAITMGAHVVEALRAAPGAKARHDDGGPHRPHRAGAGGGVRALPAPGGRGRVAGRPPGAPLQGQAAGAAPG